jgi:hypothetical protein
LQLFVSIRQTVATRLKKTILYVLLNTALCLGVVGCRKDTEAFRDYPNSLADLENLMVQIPDNSRTTTFVLSGGGTVIPDTILTTPGGVRIYLTDTDALFREGASATPLPVSQCQSVRIEVTEVFSRADLLARRMSTIDQQGNILETAVAIRLRVRCDNREVSLMPDRYIKMQAPNASLLPSMRVYNGATDNEGNVRWQQASDEVYWADWPTAAISNQTGYELLARQLDWVSCARQLETSASSFCVDLALPFSSENTRTFLLFTEHNTAVELTPISATQLCTNAAPLGYSVRVVAVSKTGPVYWAGEKYTETGSNSRISVNPQEKTEAQVFSLLKNL